MGVIFKLDGTSEKFEDKFDLQEDLKDKVKNYDLHIIDYFNELRGYRNVQLSTTDWTQGADSPLSSDKKAEWQTYRNKLRDLPSNAKAPMWFEESDWPLAPGESSIPDDAISFLKSNADPIGLGTTSWVGVGTDGVYFEQTKPYGTITHNLSSKVGGVSTDQVVSGTNTGFDFELSITNMFNNSRYDWVIETDPITPDNLYLNQQGVVNIVPDSNYNGICTIPASISGAGGTVTDIPTNIILTITGDGKEVFRSKVGVVTT